MMDPLSVVIIDIDKFSDFNKLHGREIGDSVLCLLASILRDMIGENGLPGRYGADEFIVVMYGASKNDGAVLAEELRHRISVRKLRNKQTDESYGPVTISAAIGEYESGEAIAGLVQRTADALDNAKRDGGNQIAFARARKAVAVTGGQPAARRAFR